MHIENISLKQQVSELQQLLVNGLVDTKDKNFCESLCGQFEKKQKLSPKQADWVGKMIVKAVQGEPEPEMVEVGNFQKVIDLFGLVAGKLKYPKIRLQTQDGKPVVLSVAGTNAKVPGSVNITDGNGGYGSNLWYGRVHVDGQYERAKYLKANETELVEVVLKEMAENPAGTAQKYGKLTGNCCFCGLGLTEAHSTAAGFGPVCADHYGLKTEWKEAVKTAGF